MEVNYMKMGKRIKKIRLAQKITQERVSVSTDISSTHISHIENGTTKASIDSILKISSALNCTPNDILCDSMNHAKPIFNHEIAEILVDCDEYEIRVIFDIVKATKSSLRERSNFMPSNISEW
ncbi:MAG: helix-turn-helix transcriptional regulator [Eubacteriales bacterium]